jgi:hypothetical protein
MEQPSCCSGRSLSRMQGNLETQGERCLRPAFVLLASCVSLFAQRSEPTFDVASIKPSPAIDTTHGSQSYDIPPHLLFRLNRLSEDRFHLVATIPKGTTTTQFRLMLQNLLAERFKLKVHRDSRDMSMFRLLVVPDGPKLKEHVEGTAAVKEGTPLRISAPVIYYKGQGKTLADFASSLEGQLHKPVTRPIRFPRFGNPIRVPRKRLALRSRESRWLYVNKGLDVDVHLGERHLDLVFAEAPLHCKKYVAFKLRQVVRLQQRPNS